MKKKMHDEQAFDEIANNPVDSFRKNFYFLFIDKIQTSFKLRFNDAREVIKDF